MKPTITPGPWRIRPSAPFEEYGKVTVVGKRGAHVAEVWNGGTRDPRVAILNAQMITTAPDLLRRSLSLLREWQEALGEGDRPDLDKAIAEADALLKGTRPATGKSTGR